MKPQNNSVVGDVVYEPIITSTIHQNVNNDNLNTNAINDLNNNQKPVKRF